jgi:competence ComEA-like helix-hairpin-helix protein
MSLAQFLMSSLPDSLFYQLKGASMRKSMSRPSAAFAIACLYFAGTAAAQAPEKAAKGKEATPAAHAAAKKPDKPVDINNASEKELITLPGVGEKTAKAIVAARPFKTADDLKNVKGIGDKTFEKLKAHVVCNPAKK